MKSWRNCTVAAILAIFAFVFIGCPTPDGGHKNQTPTAADFDISGTGVFTYDGNPKTVTATPKTGKTTGTITVKYNTTLTKTSHLQAWS